jgi:hypothetical protein
MQVRVCLVTTSDSVNTSQCIPWRYEYNEDNLFATYRDFPGTVWSKRQIIIMIIIRQSQLSSSALLKFKTNFRCYASL